MRQCLCSDSPRFTRKPIPPLCLLAPPSLFPPLFLHFSSSLHFFFRPSLYTFLSFLSLLGGGGWPFLPRRSIFCVPKWEFFQSSKPPLPLLSLFLFPSPPLLFLLLLAIPTAHLRPVRRFASCPFSTAISVSIFFSSLLPFVTFLPPSLRLFCYHDYQNLFLPAFSVLISSPSFSTPLPLASSSSLRDCTSIFFLRLHEVLSSRSSRYFPIFMLDTFRAFSLSLSVSPFFFRQRLPLPPPSAIVPLLNTHFLPASRFISTPSSRHRHPRPSLKEIPRGFPL